MPELPDIEAYIHALKPRIGDAKLNQIRVANPFLLRTVTPKIVDFSGCAVAGIRRIGKRIAIGFVNDHWFVLHLMIAGRLHWKGMAAQIPGGKRGLAAFDFDTGTLILTEAGTKKRASLHLISNSSDLASHDPGGIEPLTCGQVAFSEAICSANHTLKRALTDPRLISGIGNAYSDEILHHARLSPVAMTTALKQDELTSLHQSTVKVLTRWRDRLCKGTEDFWPEKVTAFRPDMAVHGRFGMPCPICAAPVQRIRYASNETNYCPRCQTGDRILADRSLSRLLKKDWPRSLEQLDLAGLSQRKASPEK